MNEAQVFIRRGGHTECLHRCHIAVVDGSGNIVFSQGDEQFSTCLRSAAKPIQAIPAILAGIVMQYGLEPVEIASLNGSLNAEPFQVDIVRSMLRKGGLDESFLQCGAQYPSHKKTAEKLMSRGEKPAAIYHNCAAKHTGMLLMCKLRRYDLRSYLDPSHPLQQEILNTVATYAEMTPTAVSVVIDGCGVPAFFMPLKNLALAYKNLLKEYENETSPVKKLISAGLHHPEMIAGTDRLCTDVSRASLGTIFAKVGADGVYAAFSSKKRQAITIKVEDGSAKALNHIFITVLEKLAWLDEKEIPKLDRYRNAALKNSRGEVVGDIAVKFN